MTDEVTIDGDEPDNDRVSVRVEAADSEATFDLPTALVEMLAGPDDSAADVVADVTMLSCAQRVHAAVHDSEGAAGKDLRDLESRTLGLFEERFGASFHHIVGVTNNEEPSG